MTKTTDATFEDAFNLLCGDKLGEGIHRTVFECRIRPDLVVKVEDEEWRSFANVREQRFWDDHEHMPDVAKWLAPCESLSPDGRILLQRRVTPVLELPKQLPNFLTDRKAENFGMLGKRLVCVDYSTVIMPKPSTRLGKVYPT